MPILTRNPIARFLGASPTLSLLADADITASR